MARDGIRCPQCMKDWLHPVSTSRGFERFEYQSCGKVVVLDPRLSPLRILRRLPRMKEAAN